jgi:ribosomal protein S4E
MTISPVHTRRMSARAVEAGDNLAIFSGNRTVPKFVRVTRAYTSDGQTTLNTSDGKTIKVPADQPLQIRA